MFGKKFQRGWYFDKDAGAGDGAAPGNDPAKNGEGDADAGEKKSYTQKELDALFGERTRNTANKAIGDLLSTLGMKDADELKIALVEGKKLKEAQLSDLEKAQTRITELESEKVQLKTVAEQTQAGLQKLRLRAEFVKQASELGLKFPNSQAENDAFERLDTTKVKIADEKIEGVSDALKQLQKDRPYLFGTQAAEPPDIDAEAKGKKKTNADVEAVKRRLGL